MKNSPRIKRVFAPVLERNPDLLLAGHTLWLRPVHHIGRHIHILYESDHCFRLEWRLPNLFVPFAPSFQHPDWFTKSIDRSSLVRWVDYHPLRARLTRTGESEYMNWGMKYWNFEDPTMAEDLIFQIEAVLRLLRSLDDLGKCVAFLHTGGFSVSKNISDWSMFSNLSLGHVGAARSHWITVRQEYLGALVENPRSSLDLRISRLCELDEPLLARDRPALAALLHRWEAENVAVLKLESIWQPQPFPIEDHFS